MNVFLGNEVLWLNLVALENGIGLSLSKLRFKAFAFVCLLKGADTDRSKNIKKYACIKKCTN